MTETPACDPVRDIAAEVALGIATAQERAHVLGHVAVCASCRAELDALSAVTDDLVLLAPAVEPPSGFEAGTAARLDAVAAARSAVARTAGRRMRPRARAAVAAVVAAVVVAAAVTGGVVHWSGRADRALAEGVRRTLATSNGQYFVAFPLVDAQELRRGSLFAYEGEPSWVVLTLDQPIAGGPHVVELLGRDGRTRLVADDVDLTADLVWGAQIPIPVHDAVTLTVVDEDGRTALTADLVVPRSS
jgi:hypothetical protein